MSREQILTTNAEVTIADHLTPVQVSSTSTLYKSILIVADINNADFIYLGNSSLQNIPLAPGKSIELTGDNYDVGASGRYDVSKIYVRSLIDGDKFVWAVGEGI